MITGGESLVSHAGGALLVETARRGGLATELSARLRPWRRPFAVHDPGKVVLGLAVSVALGGDAACDIAVPRAQPGVFGLVASDPAVSRLVDRLAEDADAAITAISGARAAARERVWDRAGPPTQDGMVVIDMDATLLEAHSDKEEASRTWKKGFGFHPPLGFVDHGTGGGGEPVAEQLRPGQRGVEHRLGPRRRVRRRAGAGPRAVASPRRARPGAGVGARRRRRRHEGVRRPRRGGRGAVLPRREPGPLRHRRRPGRAAQEDVDPRLPGPHAPRRRTRGADRTPRRRPGRARPPAWSTCPPGRRGPGEIPRRERPHPGARLRITDADGLRVTGFLTDTGPGGPGRWLPDLELRHRRHARVEDRIRCAKDIGIRNLPYHDFTHNQVWLAVAALAADPLAFTARLALPATAATYEPKRPRPRTLAVAGRIVRTARRRTPHIDPARPWAEVITTAHQRLCALPVP